MIPPIQSVMPSNNLPQRRAQMSVRYDKHTVHDTLTGDRFELEPEAAWRKFNQLNEIV